MDGKQNEEERTRAEETPYQRVDIGRLEGEGETPSAEVPAEGERDGPAGTVPSLRADARRLRLRVVLPLSVLLCLVQAVVTILAANFRAIYLTSTLIPVLAFGLLFVLVLGVNPFLRLVGRDRWIRCLSRAELIAVFSAMLVTSGISTFGLTAQ